MDKVHLLLASDVGGWVLLLVPVFWLLTYWWAKELGQAWRERDLSSYVGDVVTSLAVLVTVAAVGTVAALFIPRLWRAYADLFIAYGTLFLLASPVTLALTIVGFLGGWMRLAFEWNYRKVKRRIEVGYAIERTTQLILEEMARRGELPE